MPDVRWSTLRRLAYRFARAASRRPAISAAACAGGASVRPVVPAGRAVRLASLPLSGSVEPPPAGVRIPAGATGVHRSGGVLMAAMLVLASVAMPAQAESVPAGHRPPEPSQPGTAAVPSGVAQTMHPAGPEPVGASEVATTHAPGSPGMMATVRERALAVKAHFEPLQHYITNKYKVSAKSVQTVVSTAWEVGHAMELDPLLLLAVMAIESNFNPRAQSPKGAQGLMQVMTRIHRKRFERFGGVKAVWKPEANIEVGAQILKECIQQRGSVAGGLTCYVGASGKSSQYGKRVLAELDRLRAAIGNAGAPVMVASNVTQDGSTAVAASQRTRVAPVARSSPPDQPQVVAPPLESEQPGQRDIRSARLDDEDETTRAIGEAARSVARGLFPEGTGQQSRVAANDFEPVSSFSLRWQGM